MSEINLSVYIILKFFHYAVRSLFPFKIVQEKKKLSNRVIKSDWSADALKGSVH